MSKRNRRIYTILFILCVVGFWCFENFYTPAHYSKPESKTDEIPFVVELLPTSTTGEVVVHDNYMLSYSEPHEQAEWVSYILERSHLTYNDRERPYFIEDPKVKTKSADWRNYKGSGFDRGHLCPAGDRRFSEYAYNETFYTSNIAPQNREFNAGVWNRLEIQTRQWCKRYGTLYIITGGVLKNNLKEIGDEGVDVPDAFYKILARQEGTDFKVLAFLIPNKQNDLSLENFLVSIDELEKQTGINFFPELGEKGLEFENTIDVSGWKF